MKVRVEVKLPRYGTTMEDATVARWLKAPGDPAAKGEPLCELETEKVTVELESPVNGTLIEIVAEAGTVAEVGTVLCCVETEVS